MSCVKIGDAQRAITRYACVMRWGIHSYRDDPNVPKFDDSQPIIIFDGECALCSGWLSFVLKYDRPKLYNFIIAQSPLGEALYQHYGLKSEDYDTNLLIADGRVRVKSDGTIAMFSALGWPWKIMNIFRIIPRPLRDYAYDILARNRLKWFGRKELCYIPSPETRARFL